MSRLCHRHARAAISHFSNPPSYSTFARSFASQSQTKTKTKIQPTENNKTATKLSSPSLITDLSSTSLTSSPLSLSPSSPWLDDGLPYDRNDPIFTMADPTNLHTPTRLALMSDKYKWLNYSRFADHIKRSDIHFFDEEVKIVDENLDVEPNSEAIAEQDDDEEFEMKQEDQTNKLFDLLPFSVFIDSGQVVRVTKFGKIRSCWALVLAGDKCGTATFGIGKAPEMEEAVERARRDCVNNITFLPMIESRTILYEAVGQFGVCQVSMRPLPRGTGMVAGIIPRLIFEAFGLMDINAKVHGRALPKHQIFAVWDGLIRQRGLRELNIARGSRQHKMFERGTVTHRTPPRVVLQERSMDINKKLKQVSRMMENLPPEEILSSLDEEQKAYDNILKEGKSLSNIDITDPNNDYDLDDIADTNAAENMNRDRQNWADFATPPNYVPVLPPQKPRIPQPTPQSRGIIGTR